MSKRSREQSFSSLPSSSPVQTSKITHLDAAAASALQPGAVVMKCHLPPHEPLVFGTYEEYEVHHQQLHVNRCSECGRNFPTNHYLELHIAENHDPLTEARRERGEKTYACFIEDCDRVCSAPIKRRWHCTAKHAFPKDYDFFIVNTGLDHRNSMLRRPWRQARNQQQTADSSSISAAGPRSRTMSIASVDTRVPAGKPPHSGATTNSQPAEPPFTAKAHQIRAAGTGNGSRPAELPAVKTKKALPVVAQESDDGSEDETENDDDDDSDGMDEDDGNSISEVDEEDEDSSSGDNDDQSPKIKIPIQNPIPAPTTKPGGKTDISHEDASSSKTKPGAATNATVGTNDPAVDALTQSMSALKFVPRSLQFGRGRGKAGFSRR